MEWSDQLSDVNVWAVLLATASTFALGSVWYAWGVFGKTWAGLNGLKKADFDKPDNMAKTFIGMGVGSLLAASIMFMLMNATNTEGLVDGVIFGFLLGLAFRFTTHVMHNGFAKRSEELTRIDGFHDILQMMIMGAILGLFL
ncbi:MAG: DUF1761 domain-containing protein [Patescibacteria group bacterium]